MQKNLTRNWRLGTNDLYYPHGETYNMAMIILGVIVVITIIGAFITLNHLIEKAKVRKKKDDEIDLG